MEVVDVAVRWVNSVGVCSAMLVFTVIFWFEPGVIWPVFRILLFRCHPRPGVNTFVRWGNHAYPSPPPSFDGDE